MGNRRGTRATCPHFKARVDWRSSSYIDCCGKKWRFDGREERESQYQHLCCGQWQQCKIMKQEEDTMNMLAETKHTSVLSLADYEARIHLYKEQVGMGFIGIGRTLIEAKEAKVVPHGQWESWVTQTTGMSPRDAQRCMQAAREIKEGSALARLEMTKALMLLGSGLDEDTQEELAEKAADESQTVKELREVIQRQKTELEVSRESEKHEQQRAQDAENRAIDAETTTESLRNSLAAQRQEADNLRGQLQTVHEYTAEQVHKARQEAQIEAQKIHNYKLGEKDREISELKDELEAAEAREEKRARELESLKADRQRQAMEDARGVTASMLGSLDLAMAVRSFIGTAGVLPQMGASISQMRREEQEAIRQNVETVACWVEAARAALNYVSADGYVQ